MQQHKTYCTVTNTAGKLNTAVNNSVLCAIIVSVTRVITPCVETITRDTLKVNTYTKNHVLSMVFLFGFHCKIINLAMEKLFTIMRLHITVNTLLLCYSYNI